ncbi:MAG: nuclear transport factor 2 family protein [Actinomycetota bacterium]|nr:nuclear transport factor 2 family protein [Actinomycetota bacterium]
MSSENTQKIRDGLTALKGGDIAAALKEFDRFAVLRFDPKWPENRPRVGVEEIHSYFEDLVATFGTGNGVIEEVIEAADRVLVRVRYRFEAQGSGVQDEVVVTQLFTFRRGKVIEFEYFLDFDDALQAIGLSE